MHWSLRLAVRLPVLLPFWLAVRAAMLVERAGVWLSDRLPCGIRTDARGRWY